MSIHPLATPTPIKLAPAPGHAGYDEGQDVDTFSRWNDVSAYTPLPLKDMVTGRYRRQTTPTTRMEAVHERDPSHEWRSKCIQRAWAQMDSDKYYATKRRVFLLWKNLACARYRPCSMGRSPGWPESPVPPAQDGREEEIVEGASDESCPSPSLRTPGGTSRRSPPARPESLPYR